MDSVVRGKECMMLLQERLRTIPVILGSKSPRRSALLQAMEVAFDVIVRETQETFESGDSPDAIVQAIAKEKLNQFNEECASGQLVICADTIVVAPTGKILGKPNDAANAATMIQSLSGKCHEVYTGVAFGYRDVRVSFAECTKVWLAELDAQEIAFYVERYRPIDKAGAYGIQEWIGKIGVEKIEGSYENVIGLPTARLQKELKEVFPL